jgi:hypothetical protein
LARRCDRRASRPPELRLRSKRKESLAPKKARLIKDGEVAGWLKAAVC